MAEERDVSRQRRRAGRDRGLAAPHRRHRRAAHAACSTAAPPARSRSAASSARLGLPVYSPEREACDPGARDAREPGPARPDWRCGGCSSASSTSAGAWSGWRRKDGRRSQRRERKEIEVAMVIVMEQTATEEQIQKVIETLVEVGYDVHRSTGVSHTVLGAVGSPRRAGRPARARADPGRARGGQDLRALQARGPHLQGRGHRRGRGAGCKVGGPEVIVMAGPCSVETREQVRARGPRRARLGRARAARRRLQAAHLALRLPGPRRGGAALDARGGRRDGPGRDQRGHGHPHHRDDAALRRLPAGRRAQHAELRPAEGAGQGAPARCC